MEVPARSIELVSTVLCSVVSVISPCLPSMRCNMMMSSCYHDLSMNAAIGFSAGIVPTRLTLDPIFAVQRPLCFYATIAAMNISAHVAIYLLGFRHLQQYDTPGQLIYYRPGTSTAARDHSSNSDSNGPKPIVFVHGIGIGFLPYLALIFGLPTEVDVFLVEWPHVAMQMTVRGPTVEESVSSIVRVLDDHHHESACFVAHSLGTVLVPWMLHDPRGRRRVSSTVLMDPVCFLLCDPTVATKFVYKDPTNALDFLMHFHLSRSVLLLLQTMMMMMMVMMHCCTECISSSISHSINMI